MTTSAIYISHFTKPHFSFNLKTKKYNKTLQWLQIQNVPTKLITEHENYYVMNSFTSAVSNYFLVSKTKFSDDFTEANITDNKIYNSFYPMPIHINEFENRTIISKFSSELKKTFESFENTQPVIKSILDHKLFQLIQSQGAPYITINQYNSYTDGTLYLSNKHKRFGNDIFNRNCRWCPPVDLTYNEYECSPSYPAPLGIRPKDFCLPSDLIDTMCHLIIQIFKFKNITNDSVDIMNKFLSNYNYSIDKSTHLHKCKYCNKHIDVLEYTSQYKSEDNFIEICHRDPNANFSKENMYWGHGECNRRQGGYSENDRIKDGINLLDSQSQDYNLTQDEMSVLKSLMLKLNVQ